MPCLMLLVQGEAEHERRTLSHLPVLESNTRSCLVVWPLCANGQENNHGQPL